MLFRVCLCVALSTAFGPALSKLAAQTKDAPGGKTVAVVEGVAISEDELSKAAASDLDQLELQKMQADASYARGKHQILEDALKKLVDDKLVDAEARRLGITRQELLTREVDNKVKDPTPEEINQFYEGNKDRIRAPKEQVSAQISGYLREQAYNRVKDELINRLMKDKKVTISFEPLRTDLPIAGLPVRGPEKAPVTIVEFSDFQCPFCRSFNDTLMRAMKEFGPQVNIIYKQLPLLEIHPMAEKAAEASLCAHEQGKFWQLHDIMFKDQTKLKVEDLKTDAAGLGLDTATFNACLDSGKYAQRIRQDIRESAAVGVSGTPAIFINGRFLSGARPYEEIAGIIREELRKKESGSPQ